MFDKWTNDSLKTKLWEEMHRSGGLAELFAQVNQSLMTPDGSGVRELIESHTLERKAIVWTSNYKCIRRDIMKRSYWGNWKKETSNCLLWMTRESPTNNLIANI